MLKAQQIEAERARGELVTAEAKAERDLSFTEIRAPFDGVVGNRAVELGQYVQPGTRLLALVPLQQRLCRRQFQGDPARRASAPGRRSTSPSIRFDGRVGPGRRDSVAPASGAQFSLLPPDNATGNFTKVVQRVAVRIARRAEALAREGAAAGAVGRRLRAHARREPAASRRCSASLGLGASASEAGGAK